MARYVVISGLPGSGKSTLARRLAPALGLPVLDKDDVLEALFDSLGVRDADWRKRLSRAADEVLRRLAIQLDGAVVVSWWRHPRVKGESGTPTDWLSSLRGKLLEVHCVCEPRVAAERFLRRPRHDGHLDHRWRDEDLVASFTQLAAFGPLGLGRPLRVNTGSDVDLDGLLREIRGNWSD